MERFIDPSELEAHLATALAWAEANLLHWSTAFQAGLLLTAFLIAKLIAGRFGNRAVEYAANLTLPARMDSALQLLAKQSGALIFLLLVWLSIGVLLQITWPSHTYILRLVASLTTAWIVISLSSNIIRDPTLSRLIAGVAWIVAALNIVGLLGPTVEALDQLSITLGELRLSLLTICKGVVVLAVLLWGALAISNVIEGQIERFRELTPSTRVLLSKLSKIAFVTLAVILTLNAVGIDLTALAVLSGAIAFGIGFGLQKVVSNLVSGFILLLDKSIKPGDVIELEESFGWITKLGARYVSVRTRDGKEFLIPNEDLITHRVVNWSFSHKLVRLEVKFGVTYDADPHKVREVACAAAATADRVVADPAPVCHLSEFGDSSLNFLLRFWVNDPENGVANVSGQVMLALWDALKENGIGIPYPHREVFVHQAEPRPLSPSPVADSEGSR